MLSHRIIDWNDLSDLMFDGLAGLIIVLYRSILLIKLIFDFKIGRNKYSQVLVCFRLS